MSHRGNMLMEATTCFSTTTEEEKEGKNTSPRRKRATREARGVSGRGGRIKNVAPWRWKLDAIDGMRRMRQGAGCDNHEDDHEEIVDDDDDGDACDDDDDDDDDISCIVNQDIYVYKIQCYKL